MSLLFNVRHLESKNLILQGRISAKDLELNMVDELVHVGGDLEYDLEAQKLDNGILVQGTLKLPLRCECARCLKAFDCSIDLADWACLLPFEGEDAVVVSNDSVDLTPYIREDILLSIPQHPLCEIDCKGLVSSKQSPKTGEKSDASPLWAELNKLKL